MPVAGRATLLLHLAHAALGVSECMPTILNPVARAWKFRGAASIGARNASNGLLLAETAAWS